MNFCCCFCCVLLFTLLVEGIPQASQVVIGNRRVSTLSETVVRVELKGPLGFEDRNTFTVVNRDSFPGVPIRSTTKSNGIFTVQTDFYQVVLPETEEGNECSTIQKFAQLKDGVRVEEFPGGVVDLSLEECCSACQKLLHCAAFEHSPTTNVCFLMQQGSGITTSADRTLGYGHRTGFVEIRTVDGKEILYRAETLDSVHSLLAFPEPHSIPQLFALRDSPRFVPPEWEATPAPSNYSGPCNSTSGFDLRNGSPDVYFLIAKSSLGKIESYKKLRSDFITLTGPIPLLPNYVFGTWFTWYHAYTQSEAKQEAMNFKTHNISLDVFGLDVDWRDSKQESDYVVNTKLFPDMKEYISWLHSNGLHTFFNDHPESTRNQMSPEEILFRWNGLTSMMKIGLDYWWFDSNWIHAIIPGVFGLDQRVWVQYVYRSITSRYNKENHPGIQTHSMGMFTSNHPSHHRFPVHWTGDIHTEAFEQNLKYTVDNGIAFKPYVHPDCGGFIGNDSDEVYTRWIQFCSLSNIIRIHCSTPYHRQPWRYTPQTESIVKRFIDLRYSLLPSIISDAQRATDEGTPIIKRCDFNWPELKDASRSDQYLLVNSILVAPVVPFPEGNKSRNVWIPPGSWQDAFSGKTYVGPQNVIITSPVEQIPFMYQLGSLFVTALPSENVEKQDWEHLFIEAFPNYDSNNEIETSFVFYDTKQQQQQQKEKVEDDNQRIAPKTVIKMKQISETNAIISIEPQEENFIGNRIWTIRIHPTVGSKLEKAMNNLFVVIDGNNMKINNEQQSNNNADAGVPLLPFVGKSILIDIPKSNKSQNHKIILNW